MCSSLEITKRKQQNETALKTADPRLIKFLDWCFGDELDRMKLQEANIQCSKNVELLHWEKVACCRG